MLILATKIGEWIDIGEGKNAVRVRFLSFSKDFHSIRLGFEADKSVHILRSDAKKGKKDE